MSKDAKTRLMGRLAALRRRQGERTRPAPITDGLVERLNAVANSIPDTDTDTIDSLESLVARLQEKQDDQERQRQQRTIRREPELPRDPSEEDIEKAALKAEIERLEALVRDAQPSPQEASAPKERSGVRRRDVILGAAGTLLTVGIIGWLAGKQDVTETPRQKEAREKAEAKRAQEKAAQESAQDKLKYITSFITGYGAATDKDEFNAAVAKSCEPFALAFFATKGDTYKNKPLLDLKLAGEPVFSDSSLTLEFTAEMMGSLGQDSPATLKYKLELAVNDPKNPTQITLSRATVEEWLGFTTGTRAYLEGKGKKGFKYLENLFSTAMSARGLNGQAILEAIKTVSDNPNSPAVKESAALNLNRSAEAERSCERSARKYRTCPAPQ
jgi:hypothetical protein